MKFWESSEGILESHTGTDSASQLASQAREVPNFSISVTSHPPYLIVCQLNIYTRTLILTPSC